MERFTEKTPGGAVNIHYPRKCFFPDGTSDKIAKSAFRQNAIEKLCAYEDTGLEPEEIYQFRNLTKTIPLDRLRELAQADKEGRCVVLPCKVGDVINAFRWNDEKSIYIISDKVTSVTVNKNGWTVKTKEKFYPIKEKEGYEFAPINEYPNALADFYVGTREEAEKALGGGQDERD